MTPRSFWLTILKLIGLYLIFSLLMLFGSLIYAINTAGYSQFNSVINGAMIFAFIIYIVLIGILLFKPSMVIKLLKLDADYQEESLQLSLPYPGIWRIAIIVFGAIILAESIPAFFSYLLQFLAELKENTIINKNMIVLYLVKTIIGYILISFSKPLSALLEKKER